MSLFWNPRTSAEFDLAPCGKSCSHVLCLKNNAHHLEGDNGYYTLWECEHGFWLLQAEEPVKSVEQPKMSAAEYMLVELRAKKSAGTISWGDEAYLDDLEFYHSETPENREARLESMARRGVVEDQQVMQSKVLRKEEKWTANGAMKFRVPRPCKYATLFAQRTCARCSSKLAAGQEVCTAQIVREEGMERRRDGHMAGTGALITRLAKAGEHSSPCGEKLAGCWNHEQHGTCIYIHPDEPQWASACNGTLGYDRVRQAFIVAGQEATSRFADLKGARPPLNPSNQGQSKRPRSSWVSK